LSVDKKNLKTKVFSQLAKQADKEKESENFRFQPTAGAVE
jgi:hypothetical protein